MKTTILVSQSFNPPAGFFFGRDYRFTRIVSKCRQNEAGNRDTGSGGLPGLLTPCGACRQFINEFESDTIIILVDAQTGEIRKELLLTDLLPDSFKL